MLISVLEMVRMKLMSMMRMMSMMSMMSMGETKCEEEECSCIQLIYAWTEHEGSKSDYSD